jgi:hypothetical protein
VSRPQLARLAQPFPSRLIREKPGSHASSYVNHAVVTQKLLAVLDSYSFEVVEVIRNDHTKAGPNVVQAVLCRMTAVVDGHLYEITEVGDCEQPGNWNTDGARLKDAMSDAFKRCAMRLGVGLHLWSQKDGFFLHDQLTKEDA